jgi:CcmD family protein
MQLQDLPLLVVALIVFVGLFFFVWSIDSRARRLEQELRDEIAADAAADREDGI